ncbi:MAG: AAA family ATPase [Thermodesulfobacteriota bacterium]
MYTQFYGFSEKPFNITPDPRFLYQTVDHREALASMIYGIKERKGFIAITGEVGTGKTTLIFTLLKELQGGVKTVFIFHTNITFVQLLVNILSELEIPIPDEKETTLLRGLYDYLIRGLSRNENLTIIIDEAQNLSREVMEGLRMLSNLETATSKLLQIILVGQPELDVKLNAADLRQLRQRIEIKRQLRPLSRKECQEYIDHRLKLVGSSSLQIFTPESISLICDYGKGIPRTINILCDNALLIGYGLSRKKIDASILYEAVRDMGGPRLAKPNPPQPLRNSSQPPPFPPDASPELRREPIPGEKTSSLPSSLLAKMIHSLRDTMGSIKTTSQLLINQFEEVDSKKSYGRIVQNDIQNMDWGLDSLLHYIHLNAPIEKTNTVHALLEEMFKHFEKQLKEKEIKAYKRFEKDLPEAAVHDEFLRYILAATLQYALSRLSPHGRVGLITKSSRSHKGSDRNDPSWKENGESIEILVVFTDGERPEEPSGVRSGHSSTRSEDVFDLIFLLAKDLVQKNRGRMNLNVNENRSRTMISLRLPAERRKVLYYQPMTV